MGTRKVYLDFQDGNGFVDVSHLVKYDTFQYTQRAFNDTYRFAQNEASFSVLYDSVIFPKLRYVSDDIIVRIVDLNANACLTTENDWFLLTENSFYLCAEENIAVPVFYGHIPPTRSRVYNGILQNTVFTLEAIDDLDWMDVPVGDVVYTGYQVCSPEDPTHSIVHALSLIAGWDASRVTSVVHIDTVIPKFAPNSKDDMVKDVLDTLLYEYGYTLNLDVVGHVSPVRWNMPSDVIPSFTFDDSNIVVEASIVDEVRSNDSIKLTYFELGTAENVRVYTDDNCGFNDIGEFAGYTIPAGYDYPPETNTIDESTGLPQVVEQEYTDDAIKYWTNKAIKENLDYNYKAFSSDFSAMVATDSHFVDRRMDAGITVVETTFGNKKCHLLYRNSTSGPLKIYYNNVYADVWYKSSERTVTRNAVTEPTNPLEYTASFVFTEAAALSLVKAISAQQEIGNVLFSFQSERDVAIGSFVEVVMLDGTDQTCIVRERTYDENTMMHSYTCVACSLDRGTLSSSVVLVNVNVTTVSPFIMTLSTGQINVPYTGATPDFSGAFTDITITQSGLDVTEDWTFSVTPTDVTGSFTGNRYVIDSISAATASVVLKASRANWSDLTMELTVIKAVGEKGEAGTSVVIKGSVPNYTYLEDIESPAEGDLYTVLATGGGYTAGDGAVWDGAEWNNVGPIQGPAGAPGTSYYLHIRYSANSKGDPFNTTVNTYIGTAVTTSAVAPTLYTAYTWSKFIGQDGANAVVITALPATPAGTYTGQVGMYGSRVYQWNGTAWVLQNVQPRYLGKFLDTYASTYTIGDWCTRYFETAGDANRGVFYWNGASWVRTTDPAYTGNGAITDILWICAQVDGGVFIYGTVAEYGTTYFQNLFAQYIKILSNGAIYGGNRFTPDPSGNPVEDPTQGNGFWLGADGKLKANLQSLFKNNVIIGTDAGLGLLATGSNGYQNVVSGDSALYTGGSVYASCVYGANAAFTASSGWGGSVFGYEAAIGCHTLQQDAYFGYRSGYASIFTPYCTLLGALSGFGLQYSEYSTLVGYRAGDGLVGTSSMLTTRSNSFFGAYAGSGATDQSYCVALGVGSSINPDAGDHQISIGGRVRYFEFPDGTTQGEVYTVINPYLSTTLLAYTQIMGNLFTAGSEGMSYMQRTTATQITLRNHNTTLIETINSGSSTEIQAKLQIMLLSW